MSRPIKNMVPVDDEARLWERIEGETDKQWQAFRSFRDVPTTDRTVKEAFVRSSGRTDTINAPSWWYEVSQRFRWRERAHAFDQYLDRKTIEAELDERVRSRKLRRAVLTKALSKAATEMGTLDLSKASAGEWSRFLEVVVKQLRDEYDEAPTQKVKLGGMQAEDGSAIPVVITYAQSKV